MQDASAPAESRRAARTALAVFVAAFTYAVVRYVILGTTPAAQIPLYVTNKAIAVTALALLGLAITGHRPEARRARGLAGAGLALLHVLLTVPILTPAYFRGLFSGELLTAPAGLAVLVGAGASLMLLCLVHPAARWPVAARARLAVLVLTLVGGHVLALGAPGWRIGLDRLPAISLLSFVYVVSVLGVRARRRRVIVPRRARADVASLALDP